MTVIRDRAYQARLDEGFRLASGDIVARDGVTAELLRAMSRINRRIRVAMVVTIHVNRQ